MCECHYSACACTILVSFNITATLARIVIYQVNQSLITCLLLFLFILFISRVQLYKSDDDSSIASSSYEHHVSQGSSPHHEGQMESTFGERIDPEISGKLLEMAIQSQKVGSSSSNASSPEVNCPPGKGERFDY